MGTIFLIKAEPKKTNQNAFLKTFRINNFLGGIKESSTFLKSWLFKVVPVFLPDAIMTIFSTFWWIFEDSAAKLDFISIELKKFSSRASLVLLINY